VAILKVKVRAVDDVDPSVAKDLVVVDAPGLVHVRLIVKTRASHAEHNVHNTICGK
jgi:hypothetical protein